MDDHSSWRILRHFVLFLGIWINYFSTSIRITICNYSFKLLYMQIFSPEHSLSPMLEWSFPKCALWLPTKRKLSTPSLYPNFSGQFLWQCLFGENVCNLCFHSKCLLWFCWFILGIKMLQFLKLHFSLLSSNREKGRCIHVWFGSERFSYD